jgi:AraC-like DNA-binding protein
MEEALSAAVVMQIAALSSFVTTCVGVSVSLAKPAIDDARSGVNSQAGAQWLAAAYAIFAMIGLGELLQTAALFRYFPVLGSLFWGLGPALGPCIYLFIRHSTSPAGSKALNARVWIKHAALSMVFIGATALYLLARTFNSMHWLSESWLTYPQLLRLLLGILLLQSLGYLLAALWCLHGHWHAVRAYVSNVEVQTLKRRRFLLTALLLPWSALFVEFVYARLVGADATLALTGGVLRMVLIGALGIYAVRHRLLFSQPEQEQAALVFAEVLAEEMAEEQRTTKYERSPMPQSEGERILSKLNTLMEQDQLWRDPSLTLRKLSDLSAIPAARITQALNVYGGRGFFEWVNEMRVREAARQLLASEESVLDICLAVGFNTKSTFNKAFRDAFHTTPSEYRRSHSSSAQ